MPGGEVGELTLEVGKPLGQAVSLLAQRLGGRLDVRRQVLVPIRSPPSRLVHGRLIEQERCRRMTPYTPRASDQEAVQSDTCDESVSQADTPEFVRKSHARIGRDADLRV